MSESVKCELYELEVYSDFIQELTTTVKCLYVPSSGKIFQFFEDEKNFECGTDINFKENKWIISDYTYREGNRKFIKNVDITIDIFNYMINHNEYQNRIQKLIN